MNTHNSLELNDDTIPLHTYARNSDLKQEGSQATQLSTLDKACQTLIPTLFGGKKGQIIGTYKDEGKSASRKSKQHKRTEFNRLMGDIEQGKVKVLLIVNTSRFSRLKPMDTLKLHAALSDNGVILVSVDDRKILSVDELAGLLEVTLKAHTDHEYARTLASNTLRGCIRKVEQGQAHAKDAPYGMVKLYIDDNGKEHVYARRQPFRKPVSWRVYLIPGDPVEVKVVIYIFTAYATQDIGLATIADRLNHHDDPAIRTGPKGGGWSAETVRNMLQNMHYNGKAFKGARPSGEHYRTNGNDPIPAKLHTAAAPVVANMGRGEAIIDDDLFNTVQAKLQRQREANAKPQTKDDREGYPLTGVVVCGNCGGNMQAFNAPRTRYQCRASTKNTSKGCGCWSVSEEELQPFILHKIDAALLTRLQDKPPVPSAISDHAAIRAKLDGLDARVKAIQAQLKTAPLEVIPALSGAIADLMGQRATLAAQMRPEASTGDVDAARERWEALVQPYLIPIPTGTHGHDDPDVAALGIRDEADRLFNTTYARPSALRGLLHQLQARVECHFVEKPQKSRGKGVRQGWQLDAGRLTAEIRVSPQVTTDRSSVC